MTSVRLRPGYCSDINQRMKLHLHLPTVILPQTNLWVKTTYRMKQFAIISRRERTQSSAKNVAPFLSFKKKTATVSILIHSLLTLNVLTISDIKYTDDVKS